MSDTMQIDSFVQGAEASLRAEPDGPVVTLFTHFVKVTEHLPLVALMDRIKAGRYRREIEACRMKLGQGDRAAYNRLKEQLPAFTAAGRFEDGRRADLLAEYSHLIILDFDHISAAKMESIRQKIESDPLTLCCFLSPSGEGLKLIVRTDSGPKNHTEAWKQLKDHYERYTGLEIDKQGGDIARLCFVSYDPDLYHNPEAVAWHFEPTLYNSKVAPYDNVRIHSRGISRLQTEMILERIERGGMDITSPYGDWLNIAFALSDEFGEQGREYFHRISRFHSEYDAKECDQKFSHCLQTGRGAIGIGTLFHLALKHGIDIRTEEPEEDITAHTPGLNSMELPAFPSEIFPDEIAAFIEQSSEIMCCPPDFIGVSVLVSLASAIGNSREIGLHGDRREGARIFAAIVARPGSKKSPALKFATQPIQKAHHELLQRYKLKREEYEREMEQFDSDLERWKERRKKGIEESKPDAPKEPIPEQLITTDVTMEALLAVLSDNPRGMLFLLDELSAWVNSFNQYRGGKGADQEKWLSFWSGSPISMNRKSQAEPIAIARPFVNVLGCLPPDVLSSLSGDRKGETGFVDRILFCYPESVPDELKFDEIDPRLKTAYATLFEYLLSLQPTCDSFGNPMPQVIPMSPEAMLKYKSWYDELSREIERADFPYYLIGPCSKLKSYVMRFALVIQLCEDGSNGEQGREISAQSIEAGIRLAEYFRGHIAKAHESLQQTDLDKQVIRAVAWIQEKGGEATAREMQHMRVAGCRNKKDIERLIRELESRGLGQVQERTPERGGRKSRVFVLKSKVDSRL